MRAITFASASSPSTFAHLRLDIILRVLNFRWERRSRQTIGTFFRSIPQHVCSFIIKDTAIILDTTFHVDAHTGLAFAAVPMVVVIPCVKTATLISSSLDTQNPEHVLVQAHEHLPSTKRRTLDRLR